jgi:hypothetical protein
MQADLGWADTPDAERGSHVKEIIYQLRLLPLFIDSANPQKGGLPFQNKRNYDKSVT